MSPQYLSLPIRRIPKLRKPQPRDGFAGLREELLHQPLFVLPQGFELPALRRDQVVQRAEAVGDALLFSGIARIAQRDILKC